ncbi:MAG: NTP transferase domain-containing protein, partial [Candidatus Sungiibacteriota bacterium]
MRTRIIILAAGKGTRMQNAEVPKVLVPFEGKPMIMHLLDAVRLSDMDSKPVIVVGHDAEKVKSALGAGYEYIVQAEQLGTGHAVQCAEKLLAGKTDQVIILYGDHPLVKASTIINLRKLHEQQHCPLSMMTVRIDDFDDWRAPFADFSRI